MRLFRQTALFIVFFALTTTAATIYIRNAVILPHQIEGEAVNDRRDAARLLKAFEQRVRALHVNATDYAVWDISYQVFAGATGDIAAELNPQVMNNLGIDLAAYIRLPDAQIVWQRAVERNTAELSDGASDEVAQFAAQLQRALAASRTAPLAGYVQMPRGVMLFAAAQVLPTDMRAESPGLLLFGRYLDGPFLRQFGETAQLVFALESQPLPSALPPLEKTYRDTASSLFPLLLRDWQDQPLRRLIIKLEPRQFDDSPVGKAGLAAILVLCLFALFGFWLLNRYLIAPLSSLAAHLSTVIESGDYSLRLNDRRSNELGILARKCDDLLAFITAQNHQLNQQADILRQLSLRDPLTGIANRRAFNEHLNRDFAQACRNRRPLALLVCDIDYFKQFNDRYGHSAGDAALLQVAGILAQHCQRASDLLARYGGEEFVLLMPDTDQQRACAIGEQIRAALAAAQIVHEDVPDGYLTLSIGLAVMTNRSVASPQALFDAADRALYQAKQSGRNALCSAAQ